MQYVNVNGHEAYQEQEVEDAAAAYEGGMDDDEHCADCGRELGLSGGRVEGRRICLDCCVVRARALLAGDERTGDQS
ncbi:MAG TPA: hypothetical protein VIU62_09115 [Chloroflexota bacterium]